MAVKFAKAFGMKVTVFSTSPHKEKEAWELLGAEFIISKGLDRMKVTTNTPKTKEKFSIISLQF
jgi:cinnamyl-alcohol dehydrogenase